VPKYVPAPEGLYDISTPVDDRADGALLTPAEWGGTFYVSGLDIVPEQTYEVHADCGSAGAPQLSEAVETTTTLWGDSVGRTPTGHNGPPDGQVDFGDIAAEIAAFKQIPTAPPIYAADMSGCQPNRVVDFIDITASVDGFKQRKYVAHTRCPGPCW
jgi:hypothetical protein